MGAHKDNTALGAVFILNKIRYMYICVGVRVRQGLGSRRNGWRVNIPFVFLAMWLVRSLNSF